MNMGGMLENSEELDRVQKELKDVFVEINKIRKKIQSAPEVVEKSGHSVLLRLRALYVQAKELSEIEINVSNALMGQLDTLLQSGLSAAQGKKMRPYLAEVCEQKKKIMKGDSDVPRLSCTFYTKPT